MCQCQPADPMDPGDAADLSIMGRRQDNPASPRAGVRSFAGTFAQDQLKINTFLTNATESLGLR
ncbi:hypothetical protein D3Y55_14745 [Mesorhizobium sp. DCY119]|jgi:hypothetical protein|nr:hypothetical protein D3Y55_14745 [Mesorhizobium sp. DCY119]